MLTSAATSPLEGTEVKKLPSDRPSTIISPNIEVVLVKLKILIVSCLVLIFGELRTNLTFSLNVVLLIVFEFIFMTVEPLVGCDGYELSEDRTM